MAVLGFVEDCPSGFEGGSAVSCRVKGGRWRQDCGWRLKIEAGWRARRASLEASFISFGKKTLGINLAVRQMSVLKM